MFSKPSTSPASRDRGPVRLEVSRSWPVFLLLPFLYGGIYVGSIYPLLAMLLGSHSQLSNHHAFPMWWTFVLLVAAGFWVRYFAGRIVRSEQGAQITVAIGGIVAVIVWLALEPRLDGRAMLSDPASLVRERGYLIVPIFIALAYWVIGVRFGDILGNMLPEEMRGVIVRAWATFLVVVIISAAVGGDLRSDGIGAARYCVPILLVSSMGGLGLVEMLETRRRAARVGATAPNWGRWLRIISLAVVVSLIVLGILFVLLGPGGMDLIVEAIKLTWYGIARVILAVVYVIAFGLYYAFRGLAWLFERFFGTPSPMEMPVQPVSTPMVGGTPVPGPEHSVDIPDPFRWIALGIGILAMLGLVWYFSRRRARAEPESDVEEMRERVFDPNSVMDDLRGLFRRRPAEAPPRRVDLNRPPADVREAMRYLQELARIRGEPRKKNETPRVFAQRLGIAWPISERALESLRGEYERVRYGDLPGNDAAAISAWETIHAQQQQPPPDEDEES